MNLMDEEHFMNSLGNEARLKTNALGEAYFKSSQVYALVDAQGEMVAGYILGMSKPYRLISFVPIEKITETLEKFELNNCCEIVCVWKKRLCLKLILPSTYGLIFSITFWRRKNNFSLVIIKIQSWISVTEFLHLELSIMDYLHISYLQD